MELLLYSGVGVRVKNKLQHGDGAWWSQVTTLVCWRELGPKVGVRSTVIESMDTYINQNHQQVILPASQCIIHHLSPQFVNHALHFINLVLKFANLAFDFMDVAFYFIICLNLIAAS